MLACWRWQGAGARKPGGWVDHRERPVGVTVDLISLGLRPQPRRLGKLCYSRRVKLNSALRFKPARPENLVGLCRGLWRDFF